MKIAEVCPSIGQVLGFSVLDGSERKELCGQSKYQNGDPTDMEDNAPEECPDISFGHGLAELLHIFYLDCLGGNNIVSYNATKKFASLCVAS